MNVLRYQKQNRGNRIEYMHNACVYMYVYTEHYGTTDYRMQYSVFFQLSELMCFLF